MDLITSLLINPEIISLVNMQVFTAVLLALIVNRLMGPIIDFINPVSIVIGVIRGTSLTLLRKRRSTAATCYPSSSTEQVK